MQILHVKATTVDGDSIEATVLYANDSADGTHQWTFHTTFWDSNGDISFSKTWTHTKRAGAQYSMDEIMDSFLPYMT